MRLGLIPCLVELVQRRSGTAIARPARRELVLTGEVVQRLAEQIRVPADSANRVRRPAGTRATACGARRDSRT